MRISETQEGSILAILVKPKSGDFRIVVEHDEILVFCREEPVKGKVNKEIVKEFSKLFLRKVKLVSGHSSKQKKLFIEDACKSEIEHILLRETGQP